MSQSRESPCIYIYISALVGVCELNKLQNARCSDKDDSSNNLISVEAKPVIAVGNSCSRSQRQLK